MLQDRMNELIDILLQASEVYYAGREPIMTDKEYDNLYSELSNLEKQTGVTLFNSPTRKVGFEESSNLKIKHTKPILSLNNTKSVDDLLDFLGKEEGILSWKLDGVSIVLYYSNGNLIRALSRGNGHYGKDITQNVLQMQYVPKTISVKFNIIIRGEGCITNKDFEYINEHEADKKFSNPRNLVAGLINTKAGSPLLKYASFIAHTAVQLETEDGQLPTRFAELSFLEKRKFKVVPHLKVSYLTLAKMIEDFDYNTAFYEYPVDGLVLTLNDVKYGQSLGATERFPKHSLAYKWPDEEIITKVVDVEWSVAQTGLITPIVIFEPVRLEGTDVRRANLHSLKIFEELKLGIGDIIRVYKANKIIPIVEENLTRSGGLTYPDRCPICNAETYIVETDKTRKLYCRRDMPWKCIE